MFAKSIIKDSRSINDPSRVVRKPQFGASLSDYSRVIIYHHNMFTIQATGLIFKPLHCLLNLRMGPIS